MMAFKKPETRIVPLDLGTLTPREVERKIIDGVRKYATRQDNWAGADKNTPFLGHIVGMGIESANRVDITMAIERQFLTRKTRRVPLEDGGARFRLEQGELGKLMILEGEDTFAATPGLAVKMLMDLGHMPADAAYLEDVASFAAVVVAGDGYRLNESLRRALARLKACEPATREEALANVRALAAQAQGYLDTTSAPSEIARSRSEACARERAAFSELEAALDGTSRRLKELSAASGDQPAIETLRSQQAALRLRLQTAALSLQIAERVSQDAARSNPADALRLEQVRGLLKAALGEALECSLATTS